MKTVPIFVSILVVLVASGASARTWHILPDGSGDAPTIKAGIDSAAAGDTVVAACGTYFESGLEMKSDLVLVSETGSADCATIDAEWHDRALACQDCNGTAEIIGFTITHGRPPGGQTRRGGGMLLTASSATVKGCTFVDNAAEYGAGALCSGGSSVFTGCAFLNGQGEVGAGVFCEYSNPAINGCVFAGNISVSVGTVYCRESSPSIVNCTFYGNMANFGSGVGCGAFSSPQIENTIISYSTFGEAFSCGTESYPRLTCCDVFGNVDGDWAGCVSSQNGADGNISADPRFCDAADGDFTLESCSPCLPGNHPDGYDCGGIIGVLGSGCECATATEPTTWGAIKALHK